MKKAKSIQTLLPKKGIVGDKIALFIECVKCNKGRVYLIDSSLCSIQNKKLGAMSIEVECENCKNVIFVGIGYVSEKKGFSYKTPNCFDKQGIQIIDDNGLGNLK